MKPVPVLNVVIRRKCHSSRNVLGLESGPNPVRLRVVKVWLGYLSRPPRVANNLQRFAMQPLFNTAHFQIAFRYSGQATGAV